jgi:hypothetical protein
MHTVLAATAALLATAFALLTLERFLARRRRHELMWTIALAMFALGSLGLWLGAAIGWTEWTFKLFYLFGAVLNVPFLALGTVYLLAQRRTGDIAAGVVSLVAAFAAGIVVAAPVLAIIDPDALPQGSAVFGIGPRIAAGVGSGVAAMVIFGGAIWSAVRLLSGRRRSAAAGPTPISSGRLAVGNLLIAVGVLVLSAGGLLNSVVDEMDGFAISLVIGIAVIFAGFLVTMAGSPTRADSPTPRSLTPGPSVSVTPPNPGTKTDGKRGARMPGLVVEVD